MRESCRRPTPCAQRAAACIASPECSTLATGLASADDQNEPAGSSDPRPRLPGPSTGPRGDGD